MRGISIGFWLAALVSLIMGFNKMFVYENPDSYILVKKNAHVGGDAYNYIINGTHSTAFFVLFSGLLIAGLMVEIIIAIKGEQAEELVIEDDVATVITCESCNLDYKEKETRLVESQGEIFCLGCYEEWEKEYQTQKKEGTE